MAFRSPQAPLPAEKRRNVKVVLEEGDNWQGGNTLGTVAALWP